MLHSKPLWSVVALVSIGLFSITSCKDQKDAPKASETNMDTGDASLDKKDSTFIVTADGINLEEINLGKLAGQKSNTSTVDSLSQMMIENHTQLKKDLAALAQEKDMTITSSLSTDAEKAHTKLSGLSGTDFDKEYVDMMVAGHKKAVGLFEKESLQTQDPEIKQYVTTALPVLKKHLAHAEKSQKVLGENQ